MKMKEAAYCSIEGLGLCPKKPLGPAGYGLVAVGGWQRWCMQARPRPNFGGSGEWVRWVRWLFCWCMLSRLKPGGRETPVCEKRRFALAFTLL
eukprot:scaffold16440_cov146-Skeletonema_dohrnii-CCMP3373.AAC.2